MYRFAVEDEKVLMWLSLTLLSLSILAGIIILTNYRPKDIMNVVYFVSILSFGVVGMALVYSSTQGKIATKYKNKHIRYLLACAGFVIYAISIIVASNFVIESSDPISLFLSGLIILFFIGLITTYNKLKKISREERHECV
ncbi:hypothetical protein [Archaeoglobus veneficus]|uniref:Uncharacterized protein n=1 Tax=Archaeoglobus veneficus (strain DSM 11195 / SNP6) TaxID=693661 RepID=F2KRQ0_ARCVS|nr:hypothetical protein [Archaeoglobus veneficus]AEA47914.1 hypothetical protein Arcve_1921 [Archaeoglobus veneficus SNP6]